MMDERDDMAPDDDALELTDAVGGKRCKSFLMRFVGLVSVLFSLPMRQGSLFWWAP